ncbi:2-aminomuconic semialdehyde dehydrogenase-like [Diorhabda sublineata]|uniref:2-aminomuconic semialdehyde dehydrogenase-like n=1 Tax=Diorhabda sublineata TaxID=1163346 RepID=UPI0024E129C6|nr:2-aminomuconic semialdehyde dehydrogenase-like [Diorhabda sublineata]
MMAENIRIKSSEVKEIFKNMEYGSSYETIHSALDWLKTKENSFFAYVDKPTETPNGSIIELANAVNNKKLHKIHVPDIDTINKILLQGSNKKWSELKPYERVKILNQIGTQIEKKAELFVQLEILTRGILGKDSKTKAIPLLSQYFHYYAAYAFNLEEEKLPQGIAVGVISKENYLPYLGLFLAPALAAGRTIVLQIGLQLTPVAFLLQEIAQSAGVPEGTIRIIPSDDGELLPYMNSEKVEIITLFVDLNSGLYRGVNTQNKKILVLTSYKTPAIVFDSADLDTASESVIESSWSYQSMLPWTTDTILVQENIFPLFLNKLKSKMMTLHISTADVKSTNISVNLSESIDELNELVKQAKLQGIEIFQVEESSNKWSPTLLIGGKVSHNALNTKIDTAKAVTVLAFRSIDEAVNLANNTRQGLWASIWSENSGVINEVTRKLKVSNIFVNGSNAFSPEIVFTPIKESGIGIYGGKEGFLEYLTLEPTKHCYCTKKPSSSSISNIDSLFNTANKAQASWQKVSKIQKEKIFLEFAENLPPNIKEANESEVKWTAKDIYLALKNTIRTNYSTTISGYNLNSYTEPRGVIVLDRSESVNIPLVVTSILEGNSLMVLTTANSEKILKLLSSRLPSGVLNLIPYESNILKKLAANKKVNCYFGDDSEHILRCLPIQDSIKYVNIATSVDIFGKITFVKNVLSDIGSSSNCNF